MINSNPRNIPVFLVTLLTGQGELSDGHPSKTLTRNVKKKPSQVLKNDVASEGKPHLFGGFGDVVFK